MNLCLNYTPSLDMHHIFVATFKDACFVSESKHCPAASDCRALIANPLPVCQKETMLRFFDETYTSEGFNHCNCCYSCIKRHGSEGCQTCDQFIATYFRKIDQLCVKKSVALLLREAMQDLFETQGIVSLLVEDELDIKIDDFITDYLCMCDEINSQNDIVEIWHIDR